MVHKAGIYEKCIKRLLDIILSAAAMIVLSPVILVTAILVRVKLGSPVIFCQKRPGLNEKIIRLYKFRSMSDARDADGKLLPDEQRLGSFGRLLRKLSVDELPSLWNIFRGDLSIVGPRPLLVEYLPYYTEEEHHRHDVRPGLTGLAQVNGRNSLTWEEKFSYDLAYIRDGITFRKDAAIVFRTALKVVRRADVLSGDEVKKVAGRLDDERRAYADTETVLP